MDLSIVIVSYNTKELLQACLKSLQIATKKIKTEIYVVDNNSPDNSAEMVKAKFPDINLIANEKNVGFSKANNQALKKAKGKYILVLNPDTVTPPDALTTMVDFMDKNTDVAVSSCKIELYTD